MSILSRLVGTKFNDSKLVEVIEKAIAADPLVADATSFTVTSSKGVVKIVGVVHRAQEKDRIEGVMRSAVRHADLKVERIDNQIIVR
jgi:osmotically-inducible protein OsmY